MNIYSKTLKREVDVEIYNVESEGTVRTLVTSNSLLNLFYSMDGISRSFPVQVMNKDYCYARCIVQLDGGRAFDNDGDCNADFEREIDRNHIGMAASRRAFDRAFLDLLQLDIPSVSRVYSSSEGIKGTRKPYEAASFEDAESDIGPSGSFEMSDPESSFSIGDSSEVELGLTDGEQAIDLPDTEPVYESEPLPDEIPATAESMTEEKPATGKSTADRQTVTDGISFEDAGIHAISFDCAQKGRTIRELYDCGKAKFLQNVLKYCDGDEGMQADAPFIKIFLDGVAA